ncbi:TetR/AcrR family transcriptional regulator [Erythrobacter ani]|uniref:TetR/AcrR family transcriptional regulator n=1 Tax=Erythrobacter ani TaxID=2827235 RepID=A0ABS6SMS1_9SPHN|nr:TetR/AcrR family transcriptional regulator [Erythrobacter ani]MBV7266136.1 TetR/AcrR family transcriptional regulator [Erythrobacter ani]
MSQSKSKSGRPPLYEDAAGTIRTAALELFAERGFEATSIGDIAKRAGVPKANVLYYFSNKDELWKQAIDHHWQEVDDFYVARLANHPSVDRSGLKHLIETYLEACCRFPPYVQIMNMEGHAENWRTRWLAEKHLRRHIEVMRDYLSQLTNAGVIPDVDPVIFQTLITGGGQLLIGQHQLWQDAVEISPRDAEFRANYVKHMIELLTRT